MKKFIVNSLITTIALSGAVTAFAENDITAELDTTISVSATTSRPRPVKAMMEAKNEIKERIASSSETRKENRQENREDRRERMASSSGVRKENREDRKENIKDRIVSRFKKMFDRFQSTIDRQTMIMGKINTRIEKVKAAGGNTTEAEKFSGEAKMHLEKAQSALNLLKSTATSTVEIDAQVNASSTTPTTTPVTLKKMQKIGGDVEKHIRATHKALENSLKSLKGMSRAVNPNASTTPTATTTTN